MEPGSLQDEPEYPSCNYTRFGYPDRVDTPDIAQQVKRWRAERLREARFAAGLTQTQLAERVEVEQNTISRFERQTDPVTPSVEMQLKLAVALGASVDDLFGFPYGTMDIARFQYPDLVPDAVTA